MNIKKLPYTIKNYWVNVGVSYLLASGANLFVDLITGSKFAKLVYIALLAYWVLIEIRRFHDANKSGWLALMNLLPGIGTFAALIIAGVLKSDYENNKWMPAENDTEV